MANDPLDLPHLVRVCEATTKCEWQSQGVRVEPLDAPRYEINDGWIICDCEGPEGKSNAAFISTFNPTTVLALLRRLREAEEIVKQLQDVIHPPSIAPIGGMFAGLPEHLQPQGIDPAYLRERKAP